MVVVENGRSLLNETRNVTVTKVLQTSAGRMLFARPGATVIEIFPENCIKSTYLWLARQMGLNYRALIGGPGDYRQTFQLSPDDFAVAIDETLQSLSDAASPPPVLPLQGPVEERPLQLPG
jgi:hypothetical protein